MVATLLRIENLKTQFFTSAGTVKAGDGITYDGDKGETVALVGESGCGKSVSALSILRLILWPPGKIVDGSINFDGKDLLSLDDEAMRHLRGKDISMIPIRRNVSSNHLFPQKHQTVDSTADSVESTAVFHRYYRELPQVPDSASHSPPPFHPH